MGVCMPCQRGIDEAIANFFQKSGQKFCAFGK